MCCDRLVALAHSDDDLDKARLEIVVVDFRGQSEDRNRHGFAADGDVESRALMLGNRRPSLGASTGRLYLNLKADPNS